MKKRKVLIAEEEAVEAMGGVWVLRFVRRLFKLTME
jgi:hypothetical protein